jgi:hypothetical protein
MRVLRALAQRNCSGDPVSQNVVAERYGVNRKTVQRIARDYICDSFPNEQIRQSESRDT